MILDIDIEDKVAINTLSENGHYFLYPVTDVDGEIVTILHPQKGLLQFSKYLVFIRERVLT